MVGTIKIWTRVVRGLEWVAAAEATLVPGIFDVETGHRDLLFRCNGMTSALELCCGDDAFAVWGEMRGFDGTRELLIRLGERLGQLPNPPLEIPSTAQYFRVTSSFLGRRNYSRFEIEGLAGRVLAK